MTSKDIVALAAIKKELDSLDRTDPRTRPRRRELLARWGKILGRVYGTPPSEG
jgi:hypothetical protein